MSRVLLFYALLALVVVITWRRGRADERYAAALCVVGTVLTALASALLPGRFHQFTLAVFVVDVIIFSGFLWIALRSDRFWPMWVAGLQLTATSVHFLKILQPDLMAFVFGAALAFWSYPILLLIAWGALRTETVERWRRAHVAPRG